MMSLSVLSKLSVFFINYQKWYVAHLLTEVACCSFVLLKWHVADLLAEMACCSVAC